LHSQLVTHYWTVFLVFWGVGGGREELEVYERFDDVWLRGWGRTVSR